MKIEDLPTNDDVEEWDWDAVFGGSYSPIFHTAEFPPQTTDPIGLDDILRIIAFWGHSSEGWGQVDISAVFELNDGRFAYLEAWCDTTGWGCQEGITWSIGAIDDVYRFGMGDEPRRLLEDQLEFNQTVI